MSYVDTLLKDRDSVHGEEDDDDDDSSYYSDSS